MMVRFLIAAVASLALALPAWAETGELRLGVQRGMTYLPFIVMQHQHLVEKAAEKAGIPGLKVTFNVFSGGPAMTDGLLSDTIDVASTGIPSFVALWAKGRGKLAVKGLSSYGSLPIALVTRNPDVHTLKDFTDKDRIATPGVKTSTQSIFLRMAAEKLYGLAQVDHFDSITVGRGHPDAMAALLGNTEINSHFAIPPYLQLELKQPGVHVVITSDEIAGGAVSNGTIFLTTRFAEANPKVVAALYAGLKDAVALINADTSRAAADYLAVSGEHSTQAEIEALIKIPGTVYDVAPHGIVTMAKFLHRTGMVTAEPADWKEMYLPLVWDEPGS
jgi:NitT/TauT family transport system substrate-binding protein